MQIKIYTGGYIYDISAYCIFPIATNEDISKVYDTAIISLPLTPSTIDDTTEVATLDMSQPIKPLTRIEIIDGEKTYKHFVREDSMETIYADTTLYDHKISTVEQTILLEKRTVPSMTVTQPKSQITYAVSAHQTTDTSYTDATTTITWSETTPSTNTAVIDGLTLKLADYYYTIIFDGLFNININEISAVYTVQIYVAGVLRKTKTYTFDDDINEPSNFAMPLTYQFYTSSTNQAVSVKITVPSGKFDITVKYVKLSMIANVIDGTYDLITLEDVVDKTLISMECYDMNDTTRELEFELNDETRAILATVISPEFTFNGYTAHKILENCADLLQSIVRMEDDEITFDFINKLNYWAWSPSNLEINKQQMTLQNYASALEVNAENVIESVERQNEIVEPYKTGWLTFRASTDGPEQITDTNLAIKTRFNTYQIKQVLVRGFLVTYTDATTDGVTTEWDITDYVVEKERYDVLPDLAYDDTTSRQTVNLGKGNTIYFTSGSNRIRGFGYRAPKATSVSALKDQAIYQIIASVATQTSSKTVSTVQPNGSTQNLDNLLETRYRVTHSTLTTIRTKVYKHNAEDFERRAELYSNKTEQINDASNLGLYTQSLVNRTGNKQRVLFGTADTRAELPLLGNIYNSNEIVTSLNTEIENGLYAYTVNVYENYAEISSFVGVDSAYRQWEIPETNIVDRTLIYVEAMNVSTVAGTPSHSAFNSVGFQDIMYPFANLTPNGLTYHAQRIRYDEASPSDADWDTAFDVEVEGPVDIKSVGTTTTIRMINKSHWSVDDTKEDGFSRDDASDTDDKYFQNDLSYKNNRGRYDSARYELYIDGLDNNAVADAEQYPEIVSAPSSGEKMFEVDIRILADARERINFEINVPFFANDEDVIRVYQGFAKYNGLAYQDINADITAVVWLGELPNVNKTEIDATSFLACSSYSAVLSTTSVSGNSRTSIAYTFTIPAGGDAVTYDGWGLINANNNELILMVKLDIPAGGASAVTRNDTIYLYPDNTKGA